MTRSRRNGRALRIAVASGKGGTGKTTVSINLAAAFGEPVQLADCDVQEPNLNLFLKSGRLGSKSVSMLVPEVDAARCTGCGQCSDTCRFGGIVSLGTRALGFPERCHGCGACLRICPARAINGRPRRIGMVTVGQSGEIRLVEGRLEVGNALVTPLIKAVQEQLQDELPAILHAPSGRTAQVATALRSSDYVLLVTDMTPFSLHDLKQTVALVRELKLPCGVVINRSGEDRVGLHGYCREQGIPVLMALPDDRQIGEVTSQGKMLVRTLQDYRYPFTELADRLRMQAVKAGGRA